MNKVKNEIEILDFLDAEVLMEKDTYSFIIKKEKENKKNKVEKKLSDEFLKKIGEIIIEYNKFLNSINKMLKNRGKEIKKEDLLFRVMSYFSTDESDTEEEIKKHLSHGTEVVKNRIYEKIQENKEISKTIQNLILRLINFQNTII
ncbi:unknown [Clostridium sp. CAG:1219]|nr:unknown [Clostridium sp. CAG:1219]